MNLQRLDNLSRLLAAATSRRQFLRALVGSGYGSLLAVLGRGGTRSEAMPRTAAASSLAATLRRNRQPAAQLRVEGLSVSTTGSGAGRSRQVTTSFRVVNGGREAITQPFRVRVFPGGIALDDLRPVLRSYDLHTAGLAAGQTVYVSRTVTLPPRASEFEIRAEADADHVVSDPGDAHKSASANFNALATDVGRWVSLGPTHISFGLGATGRLHYIAIDPTAPSRIYVGGPRCGVWKTTNAGSSWRPVTNSLPTGNITALTLDPSAPSRVYAATSDSGLYRSEDAGTSWVQVFAGDLRAVGFGGGALLVDPTTSDVLYLSATDGVRRSTDRGATWELSLSGGSATSLVMDPANPRRLYAALTHKTDAGIVGVYETEDGATTWAKHTGCPGSSLPRVANTMVRLALSGSRLYASFKVNDAPFSWTLYRTTDIGCSIGGRQERQWEAGWSPTESIGDPPDPIPRRLWSGLYADPSDPDVVYATGTDFWVSRDGGTSFKRVSGPHVDHQGFAVDPTDPKIIYTVSDGGIYRSSDRGENWKFVGEGIANTEFYDIADAATEPDLLIGGTQDNGAVRYDGSSTAWEYVTGGDVEAFEIDPTDADTLYSIGQFLDQSSMSTDGGEDWSDIGAGFPTGCDIWIKASSRADDFWPQNRFQLHPKTPSILLMTCHSLWRGLPWKVIFTPPTGDVCAVAVDPSTDLYFAGTDRGDLYAGVGGEISGVPIATFSKKIADIEIDLDDPTTVYIALQSDQGERLYQLARSSLEPVAVIAEEITGDLPSGLGPRTLAVDRMAQGTVYVGTNRGVYRGRAGGGGAWSWTPYNEGLPPALVIDLEVHPTTGVMRAATHGRGAYEVNTDFPLGSLLAMEGKLTMLRVHDVGTKYGPSSDQIDVEVVVSLDSAPGRGFGFQLRNDAEEIAHRGMLDALRTAFNRDRRVRVEYVRTGLRNGRVVRVVDLP